MVLPKNPEGRYQRRLCRLGGVRVDKIALVTFPKGTCTSQKYSYISLVDDLEPGDIVVVQTMNFYSVARFEGYTTKKVYTDVATKFLIQRVATEMIDIFE